MGKKTFVMSKDWSKMIRALEPEKAGALLLAIYAFQDGDTYTIDDPVLSAIFEMIKAKMVECEEAYAETCRQNAENGAKGGRPKKAKETEEKRSVFEENDRKRPQAKKADSDSDYDNDLKEKTTPKGVAKEKDPLEASEVSEPLKEKVREWLQYKKEKRDKYTPTGLRSLITQIAKAEQAHGSIAVMTQIDTAMASGWKGIGLERMSRASPARKQSGAEIAMQMAFEARQEAPWEGFMNTPEQVSNWQ